MAAVAATARRSMCIVGARQTVSRAVFGDSSLARADPTAVCGSNEGEVGSAQALSRRDLTVSLLDPSLFRLYGHTSASTSTLIDDKIQELGAYAVEAAEFHTEWEGESSHFFVGSERDVERAESARALKEIKEHARLLRGADVRAAHSAIREAQSSLDSESEEDRPGEFCDNAYCDNPGSKLVPVSVRGAGDERRTLCVTCEEAYSWGVQHGAFRAEASQEAMSRIDVDLLKRQATLLGKVVDGASLTEEERQCLRGLWEFAHNVMDCMDA